MTSRMIEARGLVKRYGGLVALDQLSFEVERGETFALIGPNGAGKTTTLKLLLGLIRPNTGRIAIGSHARPPGDARARREIGYVPQRVEFPPGRTIAEVLGFFAELRGLPRTAVPYALERVGLAPHAQRRASELSGGFTQRLSLGQALLGDPALLVLDEPTASLDPESTWEFRTLIEQLQREGKTILLCTHLLAEVERVADRVLILVDGRCAALEALDALRARQASATRLRVDVGEDAGRAVAAFAAAGIGVESAPDGTLTFGIVQDRGLRVLEALRSADVVIRDVVLTHPTLEELFLEVVRRHAAGGAGGSAAGGSPSVAGVTIGVALESGGGSP